MSTVEGGPSASGMVQRVRNLLLKPGPTWAEIDAEPATIGGLYRSWVIPLALIGPVCGLIGSVVFGVTVFGITAKAPLVPALLQAVIGFGLQLVMVYVMALIIDALAPTFNGQQNRIQAFKVTAYGGTAAWLGGVFGIFPALAGLGVLAGLYSLWLYFKGLPVLMKTPADKALPYTALIVVIAIVLWLVIGAVAGSVAMMSGGMNRMMSDNGTVSGQVTIPGVGKVDMAELEASTKALEEAAKRAESGEGLAAVDPEMLKAHMPAAVAGYTRTELSSGASAAAGLSGSGVEGTYAKGDAILRLSVTDLGSAAPLAAMAGAFNVSSTNERAGSYEKTGKVDGRMTFEKLDRDGGHGEYGVLVADRFLVQASGDGVSMTELKAAVGAVNASALEGLADS